MYKEIRNGTGKLLFKWDPCLCVVEIAHKQGKDTVCLRACCAECSNAGRAPPGKEEKSQS